MKLDTFAQKNGSSPSGPGTQIIAVRDNAGHPVPEPAQLKLTVRAGETVVWKSDNGRQFYVNFSPFTKHLSGLEDNQQTIILPVVTDFSLDSAQYELGYVDAADSSTSGTIITCSTCPDSD